MKTLLTILTLCSLFAHAQKKVVLKPDASGNIVSTSAYKAYNLKPYDTISIQGVVNKVWVDSIPKPYVLRWDTTAHPVVVPPVSSDTIYIAESYIVKTAPSTQKIKWTNKATGGQLYLPTPSEGKGVTLYLFNPYGQTIRTNRYLYWNWKKYQVAVKYAKSKITSDGKKFYIQQL